MRNSTILSSTLLAWGIIGAGIATAAPDTRESGFTIEQLGAIAQLSSPALSPDGKQAVVIVSRGDPVENRTTTALAVIDVHTRMERLLISSPGAAGATWSPEGDRIAWLAPDPGGTMQINTLSLKPKALAPQVVTHASVGAGIRAFAWSPDGEQLAYLAPKPREAPVGDARFDRTYEIADADYLGTSSIARTRGDDPSSLWLIPAGGGDARLLKTGSGNIADLAWKPDGKAIVINTFPGTSEVSQRYGTISAIAIDHSGETVLVPNPANMSNETRMKVSSQGVLAYLHYRGHEPWTYGNNVAVLTNNQVRDVTSVLDRDITGFDWIGDANTLVAVAQDHLRSAIWTITDTGTQKRLDLGEVIPQWSVVSNRSGAIAFIGKEAASGPELYVMSSAGSKPLRMTGFNDFLSRIRIGKTESVSWKNDGFEQDGVLTYPPDFVSGRRYPLLVNIHGGPHTSSQLGFNSENQFYAAQGWLVFEPNYRGSSGQGNHYQTAVIGDATAGPGRDILAGIASLKSRGIIDEKRMALTGWSYGGVMTSWLIGQNQSWCAAIPGALVVDFASYYDQSETGIWMETILGSPHLPQNQRKYREQSPISYLDRVVTPTLMMQNVGDPNATIGQAYTLYHALKDRGIKSKFVIFGIDGHGPGDPFHQREAFVRTLDWLNENCQGQTQP